MVDFKYEQLPVFYFYCGIVGHQERSCTLKLNEAMGASTGRIIWRLDKSNNANRGRKGVIGESTKRIQVRERGNLVEGEVERKQIREREN